MGLAHLIGIDDVSAVGAALLAGLGSGLYSNTGQINELSFSEQTIMPELNNRQVKQNYDAWKEEVLKII